MKLIKDLGKKKDTKGKNRRYGLFYCEYCNREVEKRMDSGKVYKSCGCLDRKETIHKFETWKCTRCGIVKPLTEYYYRKETQSYRRVCKECVREQRIINKFKVDYKWYRDKLEEQNGVCDICKTKLTSDRYTKLAIDHNHITGNLRGLLCTKCNTALGLLQDDVSIIENAKEYLVKYNEDIV